MASSFQFEKKLDLNHVLTTFSVLIAACVLYFQSQSTAIGRRQLETKVKDVRDLAEQLERESNARAASEVRQIESLTAEIGRSNQLGEAHNRAIHFLGTIVSSSDEMFARSLIVLNAVSQQDSRITPDKRRELGAAILDICSATVKISAASLKSAQALEAASKKSDSAFKEMLARHPTSEELRTMGDAINKQLADDISAGNRELEQELQNPKEQLSRANGVIRGASDTFLSQGNTP